MLKYCGWCKKELAENDLAATVPPTKLNNALFYFCVECYNHYWQGQREPIKKEI